MRISFLLGVVLFSFCANGQMKPFPLHQVRLKTSPFKNAQEIDLKYILALNPDKLLAPYLIDAGLPLKAERYGNWESSGLDGHIGGHYLSALAMMYASTGNAEMKNRLEYMVAELARCQAKNGNGYVGGIPNGKVFWERIHKGDIEGSNFGLNNTWVPLYNIHKLFAGLIDAYKIGKNPQAKTVLVGLSNWFLDLLAPLSEAQMQQILKTEHGGINEVFADVFEITKETKYLDLAVKLSHQAILQPLLQHQDKLTGLHANTQIPKVIGFEKISRLSEYKSWSGAADYFWYNVTSSRSVAFGGNSVREHFNPSNDFSSMLSSNQGPETCNSYNMLRLSKALYLANGDSKYLDFYEKTLYNHILSSQHPQKGGFVYFTPIRPNHYRVYSQPETSMWCCVGSGIENHTKYGELIYSHMGTDLFVNLFIPSSLNWEEKKLQLTQRTNFPFENQTSIILNLKKASQFSISVRIPSWTRSYEVFINGKKQNLSPSTSGFVKLQRIWKSGDKIELKFDMKTRLKYLPDGSKFAAFVHGPLVLAAKTGTVDLSGLFADDSRMGHEAKGKLIPTSAAKVLVSNTEDFLSKIKILDANTLTFSLENLTLMPFFKLHDARYQMYFQTMNHAEYDSTQLKVQKTEVLEVAFESTVLDKINCGEQQPEVDHKYQGEKSDSGYDEGRFWRNTASYISYELQDKKLEASALEIQFLDNVTIQNLVFFVNNILIEPKLLENKKIRLSFNRAALVNLKIEAQNGIYSPRIHQIILRKQ
jgi:DUF1680 family protein